MRLLVFTLSLFLLSNSALALRNAAKWRDNCDNGLARACYEYGIWLQTMNEKKWKDEGARYVRRACSMAYTPACEAKAPPPTVVAYKPVIKHGYVQKELPTTPVENNSPAAAAPQSAHINALNDDMKDVEQLQNYHAAMKTAAQTILKKGKGAGFKVDGSFDSYADAAQSAAVPPQMSTWERAGFRATPLLIRLVGAKNFQVTGNQASEDQQK